MGASDASRRNRHTGIVGLVAVTLAVVSGLMLPRIGLSRDGRGLLAERARPRQPLADGASARPRQWACLSSCPASAGGASWRDIPGMLCIISSWPAGALCTIA